MTRAAMLDEFYGLLGRLSDALGGPRRLLDCTKSTGWPSRGVYWFFEPGETRDDGERPRVVRVGTHGLRPSKSTLWGRLSQHRGSVGGSMPGGGNHRGSVFRLHVGEALMARGDVERVESWGRGSTADRETRDAEYFVEQAVSAYIGAMPFLWLDVDDPPSATSERGVIEAGSIALLSNADRAPIDLSTHGWLGRHAQRAAIRESGLWNVNHVREQSSGAFLTTLAGRIDRIVRCC